MTDTITADSLWAAIAPAHILQRRPDFRFDPGFYSYTYPDLVAAGLDALDTTPPMARPRGGWATPMPNCACPCRIWTTA